MHVISLLLATAALVASHGPCPESEKGQYGCTSNELWQCSGTEWVVLESCAAGSTCQDGTNGSSQPGCSTPAPPITGGGSSMTCTADQFGDRKCDADNVLWQCGGAGSWVLENDCGAVGYRCVAVDNGVENIGCSPTAPAGKTACADSEYGTYQCVGNALQICAFDPWWTAYGECPKGSTCTVSDTYVGCKF
ncbi:hypothetical protein HDU98_011052 [Podochytrium sp. JEL0797]|nr:hypothetical protein HDU98_011052 [Podochytrium sp. JEL0797]